MHAGTSHSETIATLATQAARLRIQSIRATTAAGSGHPTSCASAADIVAVHFFAVMRYDPQNPHDPDGDVFILSKGHAAPLLYAAWAEAGLFPEERLETLRKLDSDLEGHPTPRLPFVPVATGSLGQGLSAGVGMAIAAKHLDQSPRRVYVVMGDGESAEGAVWEAAEVAPRYALDNLCATIDINRLGQSEPTMYQHDLESYRAKWSAFGWNAIVVDGHNIEELLAAYESAGNTTGQPSIVLARTLKGKGILGEENQNGFHGKALKKDEAEQAIRDLEQRVNGAARPKIAPPLRSAAGTTPPAQPFPKAPYNPGGDKVATRAAFGKALAALGKSNPRVVAVDGDVKNSTYTDAFEKEFPDRFFQMYIAEQNMVGAAMGLSAAGKIPFAATFACFLSRAYDFIRMAAISGNNIKLVGSHAGVSIGEDGPSQMGLEDIAMMCAEPNYTVLYPSDAVSAWYATNLVAEREGPAYIRTGRPNTAIIYPPEERFEIGKCKVVRHSENDRAMIVAAGVTLHEALAAHEELASGGLNVRVIDLFSVQPIDRDALLASAKETGGIVITVEDHYEHGGIGDAVSSALSSERVAVRKLAVREIPRSGMPDELLDRYGISAAHIVRAVKEMVK